MLHGVQAAPSAASATVLASGVIKISEAVKDKVKMGATVFLSGRGVPQGGQPGMVLLAKKLMVNHSEIAFELTTDDLMGMGGAPTGQVQLAARVDQDQDASTKQPGDVEGQLGPMTLPARAVTVVLDTVRKEGAGPPTDATWGHGAMPPEHGAMPAAHGELPPNHAPVPPAGRVLPPATGAKPPGHP